MSFDVYTYASCGRACSMEKQRSLELVSFSSYGLVFGMKKPLLLGYTAKDGKKLGYIIKDSFGHRSDRFLYPFSWQCGQVLIPGR